MFLIFTRKRMVESLLNPGFLNPVFLYQGLFHCLKKHERSLHSKLTSKTWVQSTSFTKYPALFMAGYFVLYKILLPDLIGQATFGLGFFWQFLIDLIKKDLATLSSNWQNRQLTMQKCFEKLKENFKKVQKLVVRPCQTFFFVKIDNVGHVKSSIY